MPILQDVGLDALTEFCNTGMGHAATGLSQLLGQEVRIEVPRLGVPGADSLADLLPEHQVAGLQLQILGTLRGSIVILIKEEDAGRLLNRLLGKVPLPKAPLSELEAATLREIGNILASACLNAFGAMLGLTLLPSVPQLEFGAASTVLARALGQHAGGEAPLMIGTPFSIAETPCCGSIVLLLEPASLGVILRSLGSR